MVVPEPGEVSLMRVLASSMPERMPERRRRSSRAAMAMLSRSDSRVMREATSP